jgi:hypothetical protein
MAMMGKHFDYVFWGFICQGFLYIILVISKIPTIVIIDEFGHEQCELEILSFSFPYRK